MSKQAYIVPAFGRALDRLKPYGLPLLRITAGVVFMAHGYGKVQAGFFGDGLDGLAGALAEKGFQPGIMWAYLAALNEFFGGLAIALGLFTRLFAIPAALMMWLITVAYKGLGNFFAHQGGIEYDLVLAVIFTVLAILGGGGYSIDSRLKKTF